MKNLFVLLCCSFISFVSFTQSLKEEYRACAVESYQQGDYAKALTYFTEVILIDPNDSIAFFDRGLLKEQLHDLKGAITDFSEQIEIDSSNVDGYFLRGIVESKTGDLDGALRDLIKVSELEDGNADAHYFRGLIRKQQGEYKRAITDFSKAIQMNREHVDALTERGWTYLQLHKPSKALSDLHRAEIVDSLSFLISLYKSWTYAQKRNKSQAITCLKKAIELNPVGVASFQIPEWVRKKEFHFLKKAIEVTNNSKNALEWCVLNLITQHESIAFKIADSISLQNPNTCEGFYILSLLHERQANDTAAIKAVNQAIACNPSEAVFYLKRAQLFLKQSNSTQACKDYESFLEYTDKYYLNQTFRACFD